MAFSDPHIKEIVKNMTDQQFADMLTKIGGKPVAPRPPVDSAAAKVEPAQKWKHASELTPAEADKQLSDHMAKLAAEDRERRNNPHTEKKGREWTEAEIAEVNERVAAARQAEEAQRRDPTLKLPDHLRGKSAVEMSPVEYDEASRILGLPRVSSMELEGQQAAWLRKHGRE